MLFAEVECNINYHQAKQQASGVKSMRNITISILLKISIILYYASYHTLQAAKIMLDKPVRT